MSILINQIILNAMNSRILVPAKTIRFKFSNTNYQPSTGSGSNDTSAIGTWTAYNTSQGIWDWHYNNSSWGSNDRKFNLNSSTIGGTVDIIAANLDGVTSTLRLFWGTSSLTNNGLNKVSGIYNTSSLLDMGSMFEYCTGITSIDSFDTSNVTSWYFTFARLNSLTSFPMFNTSSCTNFNSALKECHVLTHVPLLDLSACNDASNIFLNSYKIDNAKQMFNRVCLSPAGLNGNFNTNSFKLTGRDSGNDQRSRIPSAMGGTLSGVVVDSKSATNFSGQTWIETKTIHPGYSISATVTRPSGTSYIGDVSIVNNTTTDKINMPSVNGSTGTSSSSKTVSTAAYFGYDYSHTNDIVITYNNSGGNYGYTAKYAYSLTKYEYDLLD